MYSKATAKPGAALSGVAYAARARRSAAARGRAMALPTGVEHDHDQHSNSGVQLCVAQRRHSIVMHSGGTAPPSIARPEQGEEWHGTEWRSRGTAWQRRVLQSKRLDK